MAKRAKTAIFSLHFVRVNTRTCALEIITSSLRTYAREETHYAIIASKQKFSEEIQ